MKTHLITIGLTTLVMIFFYFALTSTHFMFMLFLLACLLLVGLIYDTIYHILKK